MSFHKRYINKEILLENISNLDKLFKADALMMDDWMTKFYQDLDPVERQLRIKMNQEFTFWSGCPDKHTDYPKLKSLAETLISLKNNPSWLDIHFTQDKLGRFKLDIDEFGVFDVLKEKSIKAIIDYYDMG
jgi:hypothetical protein